MSDWPILAEVKCVVEVPEERCWHWLFEGEALRLRLLRAMEHWRGNHRTLMEIIVGAVKDGAGSGNSRGG